MFILSEIATASVRFVPPNDHYYQGEDAYIKAYFENYSAVCFVEWQRETDGGSHAIDTTDAQVRRNYRQLSDDKRL